MYFGVYALWLDVWNLLDTMADALYQAALLFIHWQKQEKEPKNINSTQSTTRG
jgi:hypothetical protein